MMNGIQSARLATSIDVRLATGRDGVCTLSQLLSHDDGLNSELGRLFLDRLFEAEGLYQAGEVAAIMLAAVPAEGFADSPEFDRWITGVLRVFQIGWMM